ncbi:hypothetical protein EJ110_NYTH01678 [Nymphaea thermarum]|nr:hypothetical protein EJ110_NYTH01678 [Nymphaea thermarum]
MRKEEVSERRWKIDGTEERGKTEEEEEGRGLGGKRRWTPHRIAEEAHEGSEGQHLGHHEAGDRRLARRGGVKRISGRNIVYALKRQGRTLFPFFFFHPPSFLLSSLLLLPSLLPPPSFPSSLLLPLRLFFPSSSSSLLPFLPSSPPV